MQNTKMQKLLGPNLYSKATGGLVPTAQALGDSEYVLVYFSAHWCPPCRGFTPALSEWVKNNGSKLKVACVFVSSDKDEEAFADYFGEMSWDLALPFEDDHKKVVGGDVRGIPTLKLFDKAGNLICPNARGAVTSDPTGAAFPYKA